MTFLIYLLVYLIIGIFVQQTITNSIQNRPDWWRSHCGENLTVEEYTKSLKMIPYIFGTLWPMWLLMFILGYLYEEFRSFFS